MEQNYSSDAPIIDPSLDMFNRLPFAQRISNVIAKRIDPSSIVIGIYGAWGEGKTSVLNFIEKELQDEREVVCLKFNPWRFGNEDEMLINFFNDLAKAIDKNLQTEKEKIGDFFEKYVKLPATLLGKTEIADGVISIFSKADVEELRVRIEKLLEQEKKRIVILVDDIDRLEKKEIHAVFRLVKLTADIKYTAYVLAFDKYVVSSALQERYGSDNDGTGNSFLEKIIQVPLHLPQIDFQDLRSFCFKEVDEVLKLSQINLSQTEVTHFVNYFSKGIEPHFKTPRQVKFYTNVLMFSLPLLKNEANTVDLMLIEGIRVFIPKVYTLIRDNKGLFLNDVRSHSHDEKEKEKKKQQIEEALKEYAQEESEHIIDLLCFLFPKLNATFRNVSYGSDWEQKWGEKQRICSPQYFQRYFTYAITSRDVSDIEINVLLEISTNYSADVVVEQVKRIINIRNAETFISKLRRLSKNFTSKQSKVLALSISSLGNELPNPVQLFPFMSPFGQGAMFIGDCIENLDTVEERFKLAEEIIYNADSLSFAAECLFGFRKDDDHPSPRGFSKEEYMKLTAKLSDRISRELSSEDRIEIDKIKSFPRLLSIWNEYGEIGQASNTIKKQIEADHDFVFELLNAYTPTAFGEFGSRKSSFERRNYESIKSIIDPFIIIRAINKVYPNLPIDERYPEFLNDVSRNEELSRQFIWLHNNVIKSNQH
ncbi:KAP family P-loop NTPase fold protein [Shouchella clausii]|uniref:KAP family P-loop NTPase fold protein n=1 Tax=Shouchella clausii TaxID=79880 RepID=UPI002706AA72|nr:P-loop NTPase fold protein [Shouchella clausii]MDO7267092.1 P-loop NTPase fold protein [Shouchella clausii]MDO7285993.1 P-loop NTPase fold protein [Shouchella clausii]